MHTNKLMALALLIGGSVVIGCQSNNNTAEPQTNSPVTLKANQSARLGQDVTVKATSIQDSRCPANAVCIRYGSANVQFIIEKGSNNQTGSLCLGDCGKGVKDKDTTTVQLGGISYRVVLSEVRPYPGTSSSDTKPEAVIQLLN
ncbi:hypothetical protein [Spirosoma sp. KNUC1025]|uniref:hypothetical protein n=1 Tax=Spirosoma sp. KNUC1025 TaxID=2894082 RepID=UPI0038672431|nr:hypothetical protein LN737_21655 [Spirosoma sp. KNUC1025]